MRYRISRCRSSEYAQGTYAALVFDSQEQPIRRLIRHSKMEPMVGRIGCSIGDLPYVAMGKVKREIERGESLFVVEFSAEDIATSI